ncbi:MAG TPA: hypothetical protein PK467_01045 [Candidatus Wallbacteria bacterium]|nr:hypothetical protein [Candidatus Wallbacteria bacterium]
MTTPNAMNYWAELTKDFSELTTKNLEMMNKFWKTSGEQNEEIIAKNMENYFNYLNTNIDYLNTIWKNNQNSGKEFRETFRGQMEDINSQIMKVYRETTRPTAQSK